MSLLAIPLNISATAHNAWCDAAEDLRDRHLFLGASGDAARRDVRWVMVRNDTGGDPVAAKHHVANGTGVLAR